MVSLDRLAAVCGAEHVREAGPADAVGGRPSRWVAAPSDAEQVAALLRLAADEGLSVVPRGAGTKLDWGAPPEHVDLVLDTGRLAGVAEHVPGDLVVTVGAGTPLRALQASVGAAGQRLALDPASCAAGATVGGLLATGEAGPLRLRFGGGRNLLIGVEFVRADGVIARSGGRVVKNVAGYDVGKLLCGSYGTLAVITSATFRLHPLPAARAWVCRPVATPAEACEVAGEVLRSPVAPSAVEVDLPPTPQSAVPRQRGAAGPRGHGEVAVLLEGTAAGVAVRVDALRGLLGPSASTMDTAPPWWGLLPEPASEGVLLKLAAPPAELDAPVRALRGAAGQTPVPVRGSAGAGVVFAMLPDVLSADGVAGVLGAVRGVLGGEGSVPLRGGGSCVVLSAPQAVRESVDLWGPVSGLPLMRRVKARFDPGRLLSPGRFVGGL